MRANLDAQGGYVLAEPVMLALGARVGTHRAHELVHAAAARGLAARPDVPRGARRRPGSLRDLDLDELLRPEARARRRSTG